MLHISTKITQRVSQAFNVAYTKQMFFYPLAKVGTFLQTKKKKRLIIFKTKNYIYNAPCNSLFSVKKPGGPSRLARFS